MKPKRKQKYVILKHVIATSVEEAIKNQSKFPVISAFIEQPEPTPQHVGF